MAENPTKMIECSYEKCGERRLHWSSPETPQGERRKIEMPADYEGPVYCSIECAAYAKALVLYANKQPGPK